MVNEPVRGFLRLLIGWCPECGERLVRIPYLTPTFPTGRYCEARHFLELVSFGGSKFRSYGDRASEELDDYAEALKDPHQEGP